MNKKINSILEFNEKEEREKNKTQANLSLDQSIAFFAKRNSSFSISLPRTNSIPFPVVRLNYGDAFDSSTGLFKAPINGIYYFYFSGDSSRFSYPVYSMQFHVMLETNTKII